MERPPPELDGARVLRWAISERGAFQYNGDTAVAAMAICQYAGETEFYLFDCAADWTVVGDMTYESIDVIQTRIIWDGEQPVWKEY